MTTSIWLCPNCGAYLRSQNLKYGALTCDSCDAFFRVGEDVQVMHDVPHLPPPIPDPESDDE